MTTKTQIIERLEHIEHTLDHIIDGLDALLSAESVHCIGYAEDDDEGCGCLCRCEADANYGCSDDDTPALWRCVCCSCPCWNEELVANSITGGELCRCDGSCGDGRYE